MENYNRKKLIFVITQGVVGGAQKYVFDLARYFSGRVDYEVSVAVGGDPEGDLFKRLAIEKIQTYHLKSLSREVSLVGDLLTVLDLIKLLRRNRPDVVHLNSSKMGLLGGLAAFVARVPRVVFTAHGWVFKEDMSRLARFAATCLSWLAAGFQDRIICVSRDDFNLALKYKIAPPRKLFVIYNGLPQSAFLPRHEARPQIAQLIRRPVSNSAFMLVNLGRLYATKGLAYLVEAVKELKEKLPGEDIVAIVFGDGPERNNIQLLITNYQLQDSVFLVGDIAEASKYLSAFDAMVISSVKEGFPYAVLEAGIAGIPVVSTNVGGMGEAIENGKSGILVEPKNPPALARAVADLIDNPALARKLAAGLKKSTAGRFDFETMAEKTDWVYRI
ncbi:MAG: glycosyltransferase family 4 protein [Parcubacteria group bacterium]|nr:glycosyltransferase family 4 protein [Parcubacteria group bacterium]